MKAKKDDTKKSVDKDIQYNAQDLDQEQMVDVKPVQLNTQNLHISVSQDTDYASKITGSTVLGQSKDIVAGAHIFLFFGHRCKEPVYKTNSDHNGNYCFVDIPPGYYTLYAKLGGMRYESHFVKVLPGQAVEHVILLK